MKRRIGSCGLALALASGSAAAYNVFPINADSSNK
jgi:hypothetical protein